MMGSLPEDHNVAVPNSFGCSTPRFGVLTSNSPDADLSPVSAKMMNGPTILTAYDRETSAPDQNERK